MKTTVELPDELLRAVKVRAAQESRKLKDVLAEVIACGLAQPSATSPPTALPKPLRLRGGPLTIEAIEAAISSGRD